MKIYNFIIPSDKIDFSKPTLEIIDYSYINFSFFTP